VDVVSSILTPLWTYEPGLKSGHFQGFASLTKPVIRSAASMRTTHHTQIMKYQFFTTSSSKPKNKVLSLRDLLNRLILLNWILIHILVIEITEM
jgi:hypothetical protein